MENLQIINYPQKNFHRSILFILLILLILSYYSYINKLVTGELLCAFIIVIITMIYGIKTSFPILIFFAFFYTSGFYFDKAENFIGTFTFGTIIVWSILIGLLLRGMIIKGPILQKKLSPFLILFIVFYFILGILYSNYHNFSYEIEVYNLNLSVSNINMTIIIFTGCLFFLLGKEYLKDEDLIFNKRHFLNICYILLFIIIINIFMIVNFYFFSNQFIPNSFKPIGSFGPVIIQRFGGTIGSYEGIVELSIIFAAVFVIGSIITNKKKEKILFRIAALMSIIISIPSGTRALIVSLIIFVGLIAIFHTNRQSLSVIFSRIVYSILLIIIFYGIYIFFIDLGINVLPIRLREIIVPQTGSMIEKISSMTRRNYPLCFKYAVDIGKLWGIGNIKISQINNDPTIYHVFYLDLIMKYGIVLFIFLCIYFIKYVYRNSILLIKNLPKANNIIRILFIIISCLITILIYQTKYSMMRVDFEFYLHVFLLLIISTIFDSGYKIIYNNRVNKKNDRI